MELFAIALSPVIAVAVGEWLRVRNYKKNQREDLIRRLMGYGYQMSPTYKGQKIEILMALNEIKYQYSNKNDIKNKTFELMALMQNIQKEKFAQDKFVELIQRVAREEGHLLSRDDVEKVFSMR